MIINNLTYWAILLCALISMILGGIWYGPLFGNKWMEIMGVNPEDKKTIKKMQKGAGPLYFVQFLLTLFQVYILAYFMAGPKGASGIESALLITGAFIIPTLAGACMWTNDSSQNKWSKFLIQGGYQILLFIIFGLILGYTLNLD